MMAAQFLIGTWEISRCISHGNQNDTNGLGGIQFRLDEAGDVTWFNNVEQTHNIPLFKCETYEIYSPSSMGFYLRFGAYAGHVIEFRADHVEPCDMLVMMCEGWCVLHCKRITDVNVDTCVDVPFSLLPALEDGYFSDITIIANNNKKYHVHTSIVRLIGCGIDWTTQPPPFSGLPDPVVGTILHWLYSECLPSNLSESTAKNVISTASVYPCLNKLVSACQLYLKNMALKDQIIQLVSDMHASCSQIIEYFNNRNSQSSSDNLISNPAKLCYVIKQSIREAAVAGSKLLLLCDLFTKHKNELCRNERHEIIRYAKSRLPIFMSQLHRFVQAVKTTFSSMSATQRQEVATYLVPEIETILDTLSTLTIALKTALEQIIQILSDSLGEPLTSSLRTVLCIRELSELRDFHEHVTCGLGLLFHKRESFNDMTLNQKVRSVSRNLDQVIEELPIFLLRLEEVTTALDDKLEWREFKFCFKVGASKVTAVLQKFMLHRDALQIVLLRICEIVQRDAFSQSLVVLGLLDASFCGPHSEDSATTQGNSSTPKQHGYKLNLVEALYTPPNASRSSISDKALEILHSGDETDMEFEVLYSQEECGRNAGETTTTGSLNLVETNKMISAHRVIVAARCDWFRRALLSGMREAINRKIVIHDTNIFLFRVFLDYLYGGKLVPSALSNEQLADLMLLSDRYELDLLKQACEHGLCRYIDEDSVLYFLSMADQFNAKYLKGACTSYIAQHSSVIDSELFGELPNELQAELYDTTLWTTRPSSSRPKDSDSSADSRSIQQNMSGIEEMAASMHLNSKEGSISDRESVEELPLTHDTARLESCIAQLRDIIGENAERDALIQVALAADYDVNRAINFYFKS